jgi:hypothetical protein
MASFKASVFQYLNISIFNLQSLLCDISYSRFKIQDSRFKIQNSSNISRFSILVFNCQSSISFFNFQNWWLDSFSKVDYLQSWNIFILRLIRMS